MTKFVYLACPYTSSNPTELNDRVEAADYFAAQLMQYGRVIVFSPISHGHRIAQHLPPTLAASHSFWMTQCTGALRLADEVAVLPIKGWRVSKGVKYELSLAEMLNIPVTVIHSNSFGCESLTTDELTRNKWREICL